MKSVKWKTKRIDQVESISFLRGSGLNKSLLTVDGKFKCILYGDLYTKYKHPIIKEIVFKTDFDGNIKSMAGDVLVPGTTTADAYGIAIARSLNIDGIVLGGDINILRTKNEEILSDFLSYFLNGPAKKELASHATGTNIMHLSNKKIQSIAITYPELKSEQKRIVKILDEAFEKIAKAKDNAEKNLQNSKELFESYLQSVFTKPNKDWEDRNLGDKEMLQIIDGDRGKNYPKKSEFHSNEYCLFMSTKNVRPNGFEFTNNAFITQRKDEMLGNGKLKRGDVVMTTRGTIGNLGLYSDEIEYENIRINSGMLIFRSNSRIISSEYLFEILRSGIVRDQIKKHVSGTAQPQLPIKTLVNFIVPVPKSLAEQNKIVKNLRSLFEQTKKLETNYKQKIADLDELKKSILTKAFAGEL